MTGTHYALKCLFSLFAERSCVGRSINYVADPCEHNTAQCYCAEYNGVCRLDWVGCSLNVCTLKFGFC